MQHIDIAQSRTVIVSTDPLFRPLNIKLGPDGALYIVDMYNGIIQDKNWTGRGTYLRAKIEQYGLDKATNHGRIWRLRFDGLPPQVAIRALTLEAEVPAAWCQNPVVRVGGGQTRVAELVRPRTLRLTVEAGDGLEVAFGPDALKGESV